MFTQNCLYFKENRPHLIFIEYFTINSYVILLVYFFRKINQVYFLCLFLCHITFQYLFNLQFNLYIMFII